MSFPRFKPVGGQALLVELAKALSDDINRQIVALDRAILAQDIPGVTEVVPALVNLLILFDPLVTDHNAIEQAVAALLPLGDLAEDGGREHIVDVCYDGDYCPDLEAVAHARGISQEAVINAHLSGAYRIGMYGFAPGYAYMSGVPEAIQVPRKPAPVRDIPAGCVMIAGPQCLVTTVVMPTGWSIIGRSPTRIMLDDPARPFLFDVGDTVRFRRVGLDAV